MRVVGLGNILQAVCLNSGVIGTHQLSLPVAAQEDALMARVPHINIRKCHVQSLHTRCNTRSSNTVLSVPDA